MIMIEEGRQVNVFLMASKDNSQEDNGTIILDKQKDAIPKIYVQNIDSLPGGMGVNGSRSFCYPVTLHYVTMLLD